MTIRRTRAAISSTPEAEVAAEEILKKGSAVDAIVAGVFAAAAVSQGVLLGPVQILVGGGGAGLHAIDGRVRQPGIGAPRPRGFQSEDEIPDAARVGTPWLPASLAVLLATSGSVSLAAALAPAIALAKGTPRAEVLSRIAARGPRAIEERPLGSELLAVAGRPNGGLLTSDDLASPRPDLVKGRRVSLEGKSVALLPWAHVDEGVLKAPHEASVAQARALLAVDRHGSFALAAWEDAIEGMTIEEVGLRAPFAADPVRRGLPRTRPADARPAAAPLALAVGAEGPSFALAAFGAGDAYDVLTGALRHLVVDARIEAHGEARLAAVSHHEGVASVFRS